MRMDAVAVFRSGALGDTIVTFPVLQALRDTLPAVDIAFITRGAIGLLAADAGLADRVLDADAAWVAAWHAGDAEAVRRQIGGSGLLIYYGNDEDGTLRSTALAGGVERCTFRPAFPSTGDGTHVCDHLLEALRSRGIAPLVSEPYLPVSESMKRRGSELAQRSGIPVGEPFAVAHTGASTPARVPPMLPEVAAALDRRLRVLANVGPVELERGLAHGWPPGLRTTGPHSPNELRDLLSAAQVYIGGDTGPTHLAAALGIPTVAVYGPESDVVLWQARGRRVTTLGGERWPAAAEVVRASISTC